MAGKLAIKPYTISKIRDLTAGEADSSKIRSFVLRPNDGLNFDFKPGMFSSLFLSPTDKLFRAYSIASSPKDNNLEFLIEMINGKFTSQLANMKEGDELYVTEPRGTFYYEPEKVEKAVFLAAGIGIAPFFSMLRYIRQSGLKRDITLLYSIKHEADIAYRDELESYEQEGVKVVYTDTRDPEDGKWKGERGRINIQMIKCHTDDLFSRTVYICGGIKFVKDLVASLTEAGLKDKEIKRDIWGE